MISVMVLRFSFSPACTAAVMIDSASAHSCIQKTDTGEDGLNVTEKKNLHPGGLYRSRPSFLHGELNHGEKHSDYLKVSIEWESQASCHSSCIVCAQRCCRVINEQRTDEEKGIRFQKKNRMFSI